LRAAYESALVLLDAAHAALASKVPPPVEVDIAGTTATRYVEKSSRQALVLKAAAAISHLRASLVLLDNGYLLEQAALHRMIDETNEDIWFISLALINEKWTPHHDQFMAAFFAEEFNDISDTVASRQRRNLVPRRKIRAYIANIGAGSDDPQHAISVAETIGAMYSGFVHGAAPHILTCYEGSPPRFHLSGLLGSPLIVDHAEDTWNYVFRTLQSVGLAAAAFGDYALFFHMREQNQVFQKITDRSS
jgi:hypothetical protein